MIIFLLNCRWALALCCCSCRKGISFLLPEQKKRNKENSPSALFGLLRQVFPLNKKNSLRSNSFLFFTLQHLPPLHAQKVRPDLYVFFTTSLRSLDVDVFFFSFALFYHIPRLLPASVEKREEIFAFFR